MGPGASGTHRRDAGCVETFTETAQLNTIGFSGLHFGRKPGHGDRGIPTPAVEETP